MKNQFSIFLSAFIFLSFFSCGDDDESLDLNYQIGISSPDTSIYHLGDTLHIQVEFEELNGGAISNINVRIYNSIDGTEIYNEPDESNIQVTGGNYIFEDDFILEGLDTNATWMLEAKAWGEEEGTFETTETMEVLIDS